MDKPLQVLVVEDSEDDALLIVRELRRNGYEVTFERVDTRAAMAAALEKQTWDVIIADYVMPQFSGLDALKLLQESGLDLPFIIVSGKIGEDTAVAAMKAGANDYIMKGNLTRLAAATERELHEAKIRQEHRQMEEQLSIMERLASIGQLASGVAHELNNPLTGIVGFSQLLLEKDIPDDIKEDIEIIHREAQRTSAVVKNLLTFARKRASEKQLVDINGIVEKTLELRAYEQKVSNIQINTQFAPDLPQIMADYFQLQQVFLDIIINAEHSMIEVHNGGTLTITTERVGGVIKASFADDGLGIPKENLRHMFEPFFTTKEVGEGIGLGLSVCHGIITEHGGEIYAESELGQGATFVVELPVSMTTDKGKVAK